MLTALPNIATSSGPMFWQSTRDQPTDSWHLIDSPPTRPSAACALWPVWMCNGYVSNGIYSEHKYDDFNEVVLHGNYSYQDRWNWVIQSVKHNTILKAELLWTTTLFDIIHSTLFRTTPNPETSRSTHINCVNFSQNRRKLEVRVFKTYQKIPFTIAKSVYFVHRVKTRLIMRVGKNAVQSCKKFKTKKIEWKSQFLLFRIFYRTVLRFFFS
jgi:hypothetical protein